MSPEENKAIVRHWIEQSWIGNPNTYSDILSPNCVFQGIGGPHEIGDGIESFRRALMDIQVNIDCQIAEQDKVVSHWTVTGIHCGELWGHAPTGNRVTYEGITFNRLANGKVVEDWFEGDLFGLMEQLRNNKPKTTKSSEFEEI